MRKFLFWLHLVTGCLAGTVILIMAATGVLLTYERQMVQWAQKDSAAITPQGPRQLPSQLLAASINNGLPAQSITLRSDLAAPAEIAVGPRVLKLLNPYSGVVIKDGAEGMRQFFRDVTVWHRWLGSAEGSRGWQRQVTGACNLAFLFLALSGLYMWWPRSWTSAARRIAFVPQASLKGKARDFNWHNSLGFWSSIPLVLIVGTGAIMSYSWANDLLFRVAGERPPAPRRPEQGRPSKPNWDGVDEAWRTASLDSTWRTITLRPAGAGILVQLDSGTGGQPQRRQTLTFDRVGRILEREGFADQTPGRRARSWARFLHTGEALGLAGQTVAGLASLGGVVLVWTGFALAFRRFLAWRRRGAAVMVQPEPARAKTLTAV